MKVSKLEKRAILTPYVSVKAATFSSGKAIHYNPSKSAVQKFENFDSSIPDFFKGGSEVSTR